MRVVFANTGKEREQTLEFVNECACRWGSVVTWLEYRDKKPFFEIVTFNSASRNGEPFAELNAKRRFLPTATMRFCTQELKVNTIQRFMNALGHEKYKSVVGLRYDEGHRVMKALERNETGKNQFEIIMPLSSAKVTKRHINDWWSEQPFNLNLMGHEGNCDLCFLKSRKILADIIRHNPGVERWWIEQEEAIKKVQLEAGYLKPNIEGLDERATFNPNTKLFRMVESYAQLARDVAAQPTFDFSTSDSDEHDAECGLTCAAE